MAKLAVTVAVVFLLLAVSPAHFQEVDLLEHDAAATVETEASLSENQKAIFLPSEDVGFDTANLEFKSQDAESKPEISEVETGPDTHNVPLTVISSRPNNSQFTRRPFLPLHRRHRLNCRQRRQFRPWDPQFQKHHAIPFGDDMIRSADGMNFDTVHPGGLRKVPAKWGSFQRRHEGPRFFFRDETMFRGPRHFHGEEENDRKVRDEAFFRGPRHFHGDEENDRKVRDEAFFRGPRHFPMEQENERKFKDAAIFRGPRHFHGEEENERNGYEHHHHHHEHHRHEEEEGGFLKKFRKFLNHF
ncbi:hypothetical protein SLEP1_g40401 [Rubroshorea leprosula]|uniref:Uncharacterized protein n=1 Tax=Rubroshorea leprosula TaxID=152421 RepID=A0AAV5L3R4_9ROSI|nr:hypothetical protein SLEP1_g40401 [Rubroshorea leprosula]